MAETLVDDSAARKATLREELSARRKAMAQDLFAAVAAGVVRADVRQRFPLAEAARAHEELEARRTIGPTVLLP